MGATAEKFQRTPGLAVTGRVLSAAFCLFLMAVPALAEEDDLPYLELFNGSTVDSVSADRSPRPASQTAENITVVTAKEIEALNAHTLADVLYIVTGVQLEQLITPGSPTNIQIQGAPFKHVLVLIDNVPINNLNDNFPDIASVPVQMIDRIEIVKGAASSSWGNALGGVVNVMTKNPADRPVSGVASASIGEHGTADLRGEVSGTVNRVGYYLTGGKLRSSGLLPNNAVDLNHVYGKVTYSLASEGSLALTLSYTDNASGMFRFQAPTPMGPLVLDFNQDVSQLLATFSAQRPITDRFSVEGSLRTRQFSSTLLRVDQIGPTSQKLENKDDEEVYGGSVKVSWFDDLQRIAAGVDYDHVQAHLPNSQPGADQLSASDDRVGVYFNDTFTLGFFAVIPSARYDHTDVGGDLFSPSIGVTYGVTDNTVLRGYTARGYSLTSLNRDQATEKVWTSQVGFETADIPYLWLKGTAFRNETWDVLTFLEGRFVRQRQLKRGIEVETRTLPVFDTSLFAGYTYIEARDEDTDRVLEGVPRHTLNLGVKYEDRRDLRVLLTGHYIDWNFSPGGGKYDDIIWDLYLRKKIKASDTMAFEVFASVRNLLNGDQYTRPFSNPRRWAEVGVRCDF